MITLKVCPVCDSNKIESFTQAGIAPSVDHEIMPGVIASAAIISKYFVCQSCKVIFQNPKMSDEELNKFYTEGYYRKLLNLTDDEKDKDEMNRAEFDAKVIKEKAGKIESHLDVGASRGFLLDKVGAKIKVGVEPDLQNVSEGIAVYTHINEVPQKSFSLVTVIHTLEHVSDPVGYLKDMVKKLDTKGHLIIEVPSWKSPGGPLRLPHLYHFETDVLRLMCMEVGLKVVETKFTPHLLMICKRA